MMLALCVVGSACAEVAPKAKKSVPSTKAYERANDKANFKRTAEIKDKTAKKDVKAQEKSKDKMAKKDIKSQSKSTGKKTDDAVKGKKKGFLWW